MRKYSYAEAINLMQSGTVMSPKYTGYIYKMIDDRLFIAEGQFYTDAVFHETETILFYHTMCEWEPVRDGRND